MMYPRITPCLDIAGIRCHWIRNVVELEFLAVTDSGGSVGTSNVEIMNQIAKKQMIGHKILQWQVPSAVVVWYNLQYSSCLWKSLSLR